MERLLRTIKKWIPTTLFQKLQPGYHWILNAIAALVYRFPSEKLIVVGVTGTTGKTTVVYMIAQMLKDAGITVGYTSTAMFCDGKNEWLNDKKMTMVGRFFTQKMLRTMVTNGVQVAIVETTSEGAVQFRHRFINYDIFVFTGLYPEHIESHGGFAPYKEAKLSLFAHMAKSAVKKRKRLARADAIKDSALSKTIIVNGDDDHAKDFLAFTVPRKIVFAQDKKHCHTDENTHDDQSTTTRQKCVLYHYQQTHAQGMSMIFDGHTVELQLLGAFTATNATAAGCVGMALGLSHEKIIHGLASVTSIPGRLEKIPNTLGATIIVDYAFEPVAVAKLYDTIKPLHTKKIVHVLGSCGGGRDVARRATLGRLAGTHADSVIITNEDPYDDDPRAIMEMVAEGAYDAGKVLHNDLWIIEDRATAIHKAVSMLTPGDILLVTGKGSEQAIAGPNGVLRPWDDRIAVQDALKKREQ